MLQKSFTKSPPCMMTCRKSVKFSQSLQVSQKIIQELLRKIFDLWHSVATIQSPISAWNFQVGFQKFYNTHPLQIKIFQKSKNLKKTSLIQNDLNQYENKLVIVCLKGLLNIRIYGFFKKNLNNFQKLPILMNYYQKLDCTTFQ